MTSQSDWNRASAILIGSLLAGCSGLTSSGVAPVALDPAAATASAMKEFDSNSDQKLSQDELKACRGLLSAMGQFDQDADGSISADELSSALIGFQKQDASLVAINCVVNHNNKPLEGAKIEFVPEAFLGGAISPASGITGTDGTASPSIPDAEIPEQYRGRVKGVYCGIYRIVVTHPTVQIPAKFNAQSELGRVVTRRDHEPLVVNF